jgi:hypothetical protein
VRARVRACVRVCCLCVEGQRRASKRSAANRGCVHAHVLQHVRRRSA